MKKTTPTSITTRSHQLSLRIPDDVHGWILSKATHVLTKSTLANMILRAAYDEAMRAKRRK